MKVNVEGSIYLESDEFQFIIKEYNGKTDANGRELYKTHGYFPMIQSAINHLVKMKIKQSTATTLSELKEDVIRIKEYIESKLEV